MSSSTHHHLKNYDLAALLASCNAVTDRTTVKQNHYWRYWETYLKAIKLDDDPILEPSPEVSNTESLQDLVPLSAQMTSKTTRVHQVLLCQYLANLCHL